VWLCDRPFSQSRKTVAANKAAMVDKNFPDRPLTRAC
jgi:hypothetical protein